MNNKIYVQTDGTIVLYKDSDDYQYLKSVLIKFCDIINTDLNSEIFKLSDISTWSSYFNGYDISELLSLTDNPAVVNNIANRAYSKLNKLTITEYDNDSIKLTVDSSLLHKIFQSNIFRYINKQISMNEFLFDKIKHANIKVAAVEFGYPITDNTPINEGDDLYLYFNKYDKNLNEFLFRDYQISANDLFKNSSRGGVILLPTGAGKTIVGIKAITDLKKETLIIVPNRTCLNMWKNDILKFTTAKSSVVGEYVSKSNTTYPITILTYQMIIHNKFANISPINQRNFGLVIFDEVHLLPAEVFRVSASLQKFKKLGLTGTYTRGDNKQADILTLVGPKIYLASNTELEKNNYIAKAECFQVNCELAVEVKEQYEKSNGREKFKIASMNPNKIFIIQNILSKHQDLKVLIIGQFLAQLESIAAELKIPFIHGKTPIEIRDKIYNMFRENKIKSIVLSSVGNISLDLPDASVLIQVSFLYGSRTEQSQRLGRVIRLKEQAYFYSIVTADTIEIDYFQKRKLFLEKQGYDYKIINL